MAGNLKSIKKWRNTLDSLAKGMDHVAEQYLRNLVEAEPW